MAVLNSVKKVDESQYQDLVIDGATGNTSYNDNTIYEVQQQDTILWYNTNSGSGINTSIHIYTDTAPFKYLVFFIEATDSINDGVHIFKIKNPGYRKNVANYQGTSHNFVMVNDGYIYYRFVYFITKTAEYSLISIGDAGKYAPNGTAETNYEVMIPVEIWGTNTL